MIQSKGKNKLYDEKGVFGRVCRHNYPKGFMDVKHGERYSVIIIGASCDYVMNIVGIAS